MWERRALLVARGSSLVNHQNELRTTSNEQRGKTSNEAQMYAAITVIHVLACLFMIGVVLLQQGKGADMGAAFGSGASQTLFGARGSANFLTRATAILATIFFVSNMALAWMASKETGAPASVTVTTPEAPKNDVPVPAAPKLPEVPK